MRAPASLRILIKKFLLLEIGAVALYRTHAAFVGPRLKPLLLEFEAIEVVHRERFAQLDRELHGGRGWWLRPFADFGANLLALLVALGGTERILRFERDIERKAVADYTDALRMVEHAETRTAIQQTLADEFRHETFHTLLEKYRGDEEHHIRELEKALSELKEHRA